MGTGLLRYVAAGAAAGAGKGIALSGMEKREMARERIRQERRSQEAGERRRFDTSEREAGQKFRTKEREAGERKPPAGYQWEKDRLRFVPGGPEDPDYLKKRTAATSKPERPSLSQSAGNVGISTARQDLMRAFERDGKPKETPRRFAARVSKEASATGRDNPAYSPMAKQMFLKARQHAIGDDPGYADFQAWLDQPKPEPDPEPKAEPESEPEGKSAVDYLKSLFGMDGDEAPAASKSPDETPAATPLPRTAAGEIDAAQLRPGETYEIPDRKGGVALYRWNGQNFIQIR